MTAPAETAVAHTAGMEMADVLERAADLIEANGFGKGAFGPVGGCHCVRGAIGEVVGFDPSEPTSDHPAEMVLASHISGERMDNPSKAGAFLVNWNDALERTQAEVVAKLREAAAIARASSAA